MVDDIPNDKEAQIHAAHEPERIEERLAEKRKVSYLPDAVFGAIDGTVTTFAIVVGVAGAGLSTGAALVLGIANLLADGFSMAVGNYQAKKVEHEQLAKARRMESHHIDITPDGEREEVRQIFAAKGFEGDVLDRIVVTVTADREHWINTMVQEEHGLPLELADPLRAGFVTFTGFVVAGVVPLLPLGFKSWFTAKETFVASVIVTAATFVGIGYWKGVVVEHPRWRSAWETLLLGGGAATLAYVVGLALKAYV